MSMNNQGRPTAAGAAEKNELPTISGDRGLDHEEPLIFELGRAGMAGVDVPEVQISDARLGGLRRRGEIGLPGLSEPEVVRHYVRLSRQNYAIDAGLYPLGSCTMKHNPRLNEKMARLPGFGDIHPLQPQQTVQGAMALIAELMRWLTTLTGMPAVAMSPKAGAHGELCGMLAIKAAHRSARREPQARAGARIRAWHQSGDRGLCRLHGRRDSGQRRRPRGRRGAEGQARPRRGRDHADQSQHLRAVRAATSSRSPMPCMRRAPISIATAPTSTPLPGRVRPGDLGVDAMHINLHKTFSTPHGGGGPGAGPVVLSEALAPFAPLPLLVHDEQWLPLHRGPRRTARGRQALRAHVRLPRPDGHVRARAAPIC